MIRTLIVDDQNIIREGIKVLLEQASEIEIVGMAEDGTSGLEQAANLHPDVVLLDIDMPDIDGLTVANQLRSRFPKIKVIILSSHEEEKYVQKATALGAKGYLLKSVSSQELEWSIKLVHQGYSAMKSELLEQQLENKSDANLVHVQAEVQQPVISQYEQQKSLVPLQKKEGLAGDRLPRLHSLESVFARDQLYRNNSSSKYSSRNKNKVNRKFNHPQWSKTKKTIMSWEFKILAFTILFSLGFLVFIGLS